jgi:hypothetical protein
MHYIKKDGLKTSEINDKKRKCMPYVEYIVIDIREHCNEEGR